MDDVHAGREGRDRALPRRIGAEGNDQHQRRARHRSSCVARCLTRRCAIAWPPRRSGSTACGACTTCCTCRARSSSGVGRGSEAASGPPPSGRPAPSITCSRPRPRRQASAGIVARPSGWTISSSSPPTPHATIGVSPAKSAPIGTPSTPVTGRARRMWMRRPSTVVQAPGHGWSAADLAIDLDGRPSPVDPAVGAGERVDVGRGAPRPGARSRRRRQPTDRARRARRRRPGRRGLPRARAWSRGRSAEPATVRRSVRRRARRS